MVLYTSLPEAASPYLGLQPLVGKIDAQLLEGIFFEMLKTEDVKDGYHRSLLSTASGVYLEGLVDRERDGGEEEGGSGPRRVGSGRGVLRVE